MSSDNHERARAFIRDVVGAYVAHGAHGGGWFRIDGIGYEVQFGGLGFATVFEAGARPGDDALFAVDLYPDGDRPE